MAAHQEPTEADCNVTLAPIHPGAHLAEELEAIGMSAAELARQLAVPPNRITRVLKGTRAITGDTALRLGRFFGTSAEFWLNLRNLHDLRVAHRRKGREIHALPTLQGWKASRRGSET
ncbi:MAG: HigA family addiction module antidote protein [Gemmatimonadaceae bacterium]|nr:HigA family addiction module antidote protein [Gemmatimonadaceae bacterium]